MTTTDRPAFDRGPYGWAVTDVIPDTVLARSRRFDAGLARHWNGVARLWRVDNEGNLVELTEDEYRYASDKAHGMAAAMKKTSWCCGRRR
jgi:hypothetical protein